MEQLSCGFPVEPTGKPVGVREVEGTLETSTCVRIHASYHSCHCWGYTKGTTKLGVSWLVLSQWIEHDTLDIRSVIRWPSVENVRTSWVAW